MSRVGPASPMATPWGNHSESLRGSHGKSVVLYTNIPIISMYGIPWKRLVLLKTTFSKHQTWCTDWCVKVSKVVRGLVLIFKTKCINTLNFTSNAWRNTVKIWALNISEPNNFQQPQRFWASTRSQLFFAHHWRLNLNICSSMFEHVLANFCTTCKSNLQWLVACSRRNSSELVGTVGTCLV